MSVKTPIFRAAVWAAKLQLAAIIICTILSLFLTMSREADPALRPSDLFASSTFQFLLAAIYMAAAFAIGTTKSRQICESAELIRLASAAQYRAKPKNAAENLHAQCVLVCLALFPIALHSPPFFVTWIAKAISQAGAGPVIWAAILSILAAGFSAMAHAAFLATHAR